MLTRRAAALGLLGLTAAAAPGRRLVFLAREKVMTCGLDGSDPATLATGRAGGLNDGIAHDPVGGRIYWTNMGRASADDGWIQSCRPDGSDVRMVVPPGGTFTPKQLKIAAGKLWWSDREGMRVMCANLDGSNIQTLVQTGAGEADRRDQARWCVGVAVDVRRGRLYWTQKGGDNAGQGVIRRAPIDLKGQDPAARTDVETLFSGQPEPIDLELDPAGRRLYWTDRGDNTVSVAQIDRPRPERRVLVRGAGEAIGIALDRPSGRIFYTSLDGRLASVRLDGADPRTLLEGQGPLTGIAIV